MFKKMILAVTMMMIAVMGFASVANADTVSGYGWLKATGAGVATLKMTGSIAITGHGAGIIYIKGAEEVRAEGWGRRTNLNNGDVILRGYRGKVTITGERMSVRMVGGKIDFAAHGFGTATLKGRGEYRTRNGVGIWSADGTTLTVGEAVAAQ